MIRLRDEVVHLKTKIAELENFKSESAGYVLHQMEGGIFVYSKQVAVDNEELVVNACPHCYQQKKISMLQPEKRALRELPGFIFVRPVIQNLQWIKR
ncbi:hypothetical protein M5G07_06905 [Serratia symbiotica]|nr:hypothetical protein [Serratia symbiotica]